MSKLDPMAWIEDGAAIGEGAEIVPFATIGVHVIDASANYRCRRDADRPTTPIGS